MKTNKFIPICMLLLSMTSCNTYHKMSTRINRDGTMEREISTLGDSAFLANYGNKSPFLFQLDDTWELTPYDSTMTADFLDDKMKFNIKATRKFSSPEAFREEVRPREHLDRLILPREKLKKNFRWFYTYYTYQAVYTNLTDQLPIPLNQYFTDEEQQILLQSDMTAFEGRNGIEMYNTLDDLATRFETWFQHCQFEIIYSAIMLELQRTGENTYSPQLATMRDSIFNKMDSKKRDDISPETVIALLDKRFKTTHFSTFYAGNKQKINETADEKNELLAPFEHKIYFSLEMPGKVINSNTVLRDNEALVWKVDAYRFLAHDYTLQAQSRTCNLWAFIVTGLLLLIAIYCFARLSFLRKHRKQ